MSAQELLSTSKQKDLSRFYQTPELPHRFAYPEIYDKIEERWQLINKYNQSSAKERDELLKDLFAGIGQGSMVTPPFWAEWVCQCLSFIILYTPKIRYDEWCSVQLIQINV